MTYAHYFKDISGLKHLDIYRILELYEVTDPALQHLAKKALCAGKRGAKDFREDLKNIRDTAVRRLEMLDEDAELETTNDFMDPGLVQAMGDAWASGEMRPGLAWFKKDGVWTNVDREKKAAAQSTTLEDGSVLTAIGALSEKQSAAYAPSLKTKENPLGLVRAGSVLPISDDPFAQRGIDSQYASPQESKAAISPDNRTPAEKTLAAMVEAEIERKGYDLHSINDVQVLRAVAVRLIEELGEAKAEAPAAEKPWVPDNSGEWVEVPFDSVLCPVRLNHKVQILQHGEREAKTFDDIVMYARDLNWSVAPGLYGRIVAFKVVE